MSAPGNVRWWHVWVGEVPEQEEGEGPTKIYVTLGPTGYGPDDTGADDGDPIRERTLPFAILDPTKPGPKMTYLDSFSHEPDDDEIEALREERGL